MTSWEKMVMIGISLFLATIVLVILSLVYQRSQELVRIQNSDSIAVEQAKEVYELKKISKRKTPAYEAASIAFEYLTENKNIIVYLSQAPEIFDHYTKAKVLDLKLKLKELSKTADEFSIDDFIDMLKETGMDMTSYSYLYPDTGDNGEIKGIIIMARSK